MANGLFLSGEGTIMCVTQRMSGWLVALLCMIPNLAPGQAAQRPAQQAADLSSALETAARTVAPTVVQIFATSFAPGGGLVPRSADLVTTERGSGSGVIVDPDGYIVTNAHVVRGAHRLRIDVPVPVAGQSILATSRKSVNGQIVGIDWETDLAIIKIDERNLSALPFGDSEALNPGQMVLAFGSPLGLNNSVSLGVVSAVARQLEPESPMIYVQTDASINPGSSGGPLVDLSGRLVGINTLIVSQAGGNEGLGFAAPSNIVKTVYEQIKAGGTVHRGDIGIRAQTMTPELAAGLGLSRSHGVILADVMPEGPAARAGLRRGDLILALDGKPMENSRQLQVGLYRRRVGEVVAVDFLRDDKPLKASVAMGERNAGIAALSQSTDPRQNLIAPLGVLGVDLNERIARQVPVVRTSTGVVVVSARAGALDARDGGLAVGDVIYAVNRTWVESVSGLRSALTTAKPGDAVVLHIERRGQLIYLAFTIE
jgi:serine protease Do